MCGILSRYSPEVIVFHFQEVNFYQVNYFKLLDFTRLRFGLALLSSKEKDLEKLNSLGGGNMYTEAQLRLANTSKTRQKVAL